MRISHGRSGAKARNKANSSHLCADVRLFSDAVAASKAELGAILRIGLGVTHAQNDNDECGQSVVAKDVANSVDLPQCPAGTDAGAHESATQAAPKHKGHFQTCSCMIYDDYNESMYYYSKYSPRPCSELRICAKPTRPGLAP